MCFSSTSTSSSNTSNTIDPYLSNFSSSLVGKARSYLNNNSYKGYTGPTTGDFGSTWNTAATNAAGRAGQTDPNFTGATGNFATGTGIAAATAATPIDQLMSRYTQATLNPTIQAIQGQGADANQALAKGATMSGAFGDTGFGTQRAQNDYNTTQAISGATANAYNQAYNNAYGVQQGALQNLFTGASGQTGAGSATTGAANSLDQLLAGMGSTQQQANQTGINTAINVNNQNQFGRLQQLALAAGMANTAPHDTFSATTGSQTQPDNSGIGAIGSLFGGFL